MRWPWGSHWRNSGASGDAEPHPMQILRFIVHDHRCVTPMFDQLHEVHEVCQRTLYAQGHETMGGGPHKAQRAPLADHPLFQVQGHASVEL